MFSFLKKLFGSGIDLQPLLDRNAIILDVRSASEFKGGHVKGSINVPLQQVDQAVKKLKKQNKPIITCCASGRRSGIAAQRLTANGLEAYNGGAWTKVNRIRQK